MSCRTITREPISVLICALTAKCLNAIQGWFMYTCGILLCLAAKKNVQSINMSHPYDVKFFCLVVETYTTMVYPTAV